MIPLNFNPTLIAEKVCHVLCGETIYAEQLAPTFVNIRMNDGVLVHYDYKTDTVSIEEHPEWTPESDR
jgi:hypothetical protein